MRTLNQARLRLERERFLWRARLKRPQLRAVADRTGQIGRWDILLVATIRNEAPRLAHFLDYYRQLGVDHFLFVDNASEDGGPELLQAQKDCSLWRTEASYRRAKYGIDWVNGLLHAHARGHWALVVDPDEFLVYPYMDTRPLRALTEWLDASARRSFGTLLIDMYSDRPVGENGCAPAQDPLDVLTWFDSGNYTYLRDGLYRNLWVQGGPRQRTFFSHDPALAPALNKIPLVSWRKGAVYVSSTHSLLPRGYNQVYDIAGGEHTCGALLHAKFLDDFPHKAAEEQVRGQHWGGSREYAAYAADPDIAGTMWTERSTRYQGWQQLDELGLIATGGWA